MMEKLLGRKVSFLLCLSVVGGEAEVRFKGLGLIEGEDVSRNASSSTVSFWSCLIAVKIP